MAKRKYGEGSIRQRKDGRWEGRVVIAYDEKGFPKAKSVLAKSKWQCLIRFIIICMRLANNI